MAAISSSIGFSVKSCSFNVDDDSINHENGRTDRKAERYRHLEFLIRKMQRVYGQIYAGMQCSTGAVTPRPRRGSLPRPRPRLFSLQSI